MTRKFYRFSLMDLGWNSSWDRKVPEDFVLKSTAENRELQKDLAEKAHIKLSIKSNRILAGPGYSSKEKRKRRLSETIREALEQERRGQTESETSSQASISVEDEGSSASWGNHSVASNEEVVDIPEIPKEEEVPPDEETFSKFFPLVMPSSLRKVLEEDFKRVKEDQLVSLPAEKCVATILEDYVRFFAARYIAKPRGKNKEPKHKDNMYITLDLCKEVVDGIRISFESYVETILLYPLERQQIREMKAALVKDPELAKGLTNSGKSAVKEVEDSKSTPKSVDKKGEDSSSRRILRSKRRPSEDPTTPSATVEPIVTHAPSESGRSTPTTNVSGGSTSGRYSLSEGEHSHMPLHLRGIAHLLQNWSLVPESHRNPYSLTYVLGAIHLLRLFVKLPEIFYKMALTTDRKKILLVHLDLFLDYLATHEEFFNGDQYVSKPVS